MKPARNNWPTIGALLGAFIVLGGGCDLPVGGILNELPQSASPTPTTSTGENVALNLRVERKEMPQGGFYIFRQFTPKARFTNIRPVADDATLVLAVPATYTSPEGKPEGFLVVNGTIFEEHIRQGWNGAVVVEQGRVAISATENGKLLTKTYLRDISSRGGSLFQQHLLVHQGQAEPLKKQSPYQRRALALFADGTFGIVESEALLDLGVFAEALQALGATEAVNLDMGQWSEGWYRNPSDGSLKIIGYLRGATAKQSNWLVFER